MSLISQPLITLSLKTTLSRSFLSPLFFLTFSSFQKKKKKERKKKKTHLFFLMLLKLYWVLSFWKLFQLRPTFHPEGLYDEKKVASKKQTNSITQMWHLNGKCSEDTIPIRRTKKEDVLRASSIKRYGKKKHRAIPRPRSADPDLINQSGHQVMGLQNFWLGKKKIALE